MLEKSSIDKIASKPQSLHLINAAEIEQALAAIKASPAMIKAKFILLRRSQDRDYAHEMRVASWFLDKPPPERNSLRHREISKRVAKN
jgi:hypothetical protein